MLRQTLNTSPLRVKTPLVLPKLWQSWSVASYILSFLRKERLGEKGGAFLNGKEGRVGFRKNNTIMMNNFKDIKVAVAGTGYVGLSIATLLSQHHHVTAVDVIPEKVEKLNNKISPIQDDYIEKYLAENPYHGYTIRCPRH